MSVSKWAAAGLVAMTATTAPAFAGPDSLDAYRDRARVLAIVAPDATDPRLVEQRKIFAAMKAGAHERDLVLFEGIGQSPKAQELRERFGSTAAEFRAVLIGKDGGDKLSSETPIGADRLFPLIDSMPMRQNEMRQRK